MSRYLAKYLDMPKLLLRLRRLTGFLRLPLLFQIVHQTFEISIIQERLGFGWGSYNLHQHKTKVFIVYIHPTFHNGFAECLTGALVCNGFQCASFRRGLDIANRIVRNEGGKSLLKPLTYGSFLVILTAYLWLYLRLFIGYTYGLRSR